MSVSGRRTQDRVPPRNSGAVRAVAEGAGSTGCVGGREGFFCSPSVLVMDGKGSAADCCDSSGKDMGAGSTHACWLIAASAFRFFSGSFFSCSSCADDRACGSCCSVACEVCCGGTAWPSACSATLFFSSSGLPGADGGAEGGGVPRRGERQPSPSSSLNPLPCQEKSGMGLKCIDGIRGGWNKRSSRGPDGCEAAHLPRVQLIQRLILLLPLLR